MHWQFRQCARPNARCKDCGNAVEKGAWCVHFSGNAKGLLHFHCISAKRYSQFKDQTAADFYGYDSLPKDVQAEVTRIIDGLRAQLAAKGAPKKPHESHGKGVVEAKAAKATKEAVPASAAKKQRVAKQAIPPTMR